MEPCIEWTKAVFKSTGYGATWCPRRKKVITAHLKAWEDAGREVPPGMELMHSCDNHLCRNLDHLSVGTRLDNVRDCVTKRRHMYGERHVHAKLTEAEVRVIRLDPRPHRKIAADYGVAHVVVGKIKRRETWKEVE